MKLSKLKKLETLLAIMQDVDPQKEWDAPIDAWHFWDLVSKAIDPKTLSPDDVVKPPFLPARPPNLS